MTEQWKIWVHQHTAETPELPTRCAWQEETAPYRYTTCASPLDPGAEFFCARHDETAADAGLIDPDDFHTQYQALLDEAA